MPKVGDRIEVFFKDALRFEDGAVIGDGILARGWKIADYSQAGHSATFVHLEGVRSGDPEWGAAYRPDQVRHETVEEVQRLSTAILRLSMDAGSRRRRWFGKADALRDRDLAFALDQCQRLARRTPLVSPNIADQIRTETDDGIRQGDLVRAKTPQGTYIVRFVAEYKGIRHVQYQNGSPANYPAADVAKT